MCVEGMGGCNKGLGWEVRGVCEGGIPPSNSSLIVAAKRRNAIQPEIRGTFRCAGPGGDGGVQEGGKC